MSFPSQLPPGEAAFTEPSSAATGFPLIQLRGQDFANRRRVVPAELPHALHFSRFSEVKRTGLEVDYLGWIVTDIANGGDGRHRMGRRTSPQVAFIEALDHFGHRFSEFIRVIEQGGAALVSPQPMTGAIRRAFIADELSGAPAIGGVGPATLDASGNVVPNASFNGSDDEGSVYGCIFVDFARRVGLRTVVNAYLRSAVEGVDTFGEYRNYIKTTRPQHLSELDAARDTWDL
jgi:hypothetical protein